MKLSDLDIRAHRSRKRVGRGISGGGGKTAGRGTKGQNSRSGGQRNPGFEGGQNPLLQRLPKQKGFTSRQASTQIIKTSQLEALGSKTVTLENLTEHGLIDQPLRRPVKLLFDIPLTKALSVKLPAASGAAREAITKAGGSFEQIPRRPFRQTKPARADA